MTTEASLTLSKFIRADRQKVFAAWITPEIMNQWYCPKELTLADSSVDPRVGGHYHAVMKGEGATYTVRGIYREITPGTRLVFTHRWDEPEAVETLVTVDFADRDGGTEVTLTHEKLRNADVAKGHEGGWRSTLDQLASYFASAGK